MSTKKAKPLNFDESLTKLQDIVEKMEQGKISLEESLAHYEEGIKLIQHCHQTLNKAERKIHILSQKLETEQLEPYDDTDEFSNET